MAQTIEDVESRTLLQQFHSLYKKQDAIETNVENVDAKVEQEKSDRQTADANLQKAIYQEATERGNETASLRNDMNTNTNKIEYNTTQISALKSDKQDKLTAGANITIENNVISASSGQTEVVASNVNSEQATQGQVLTANGSGGASWQNASDGKLYRHDIELLYNPTLGLAWANFTIICNRQSTFGTIAELQQYLVDNNYDNIMCSGGISRLVESNKNLILQFATKIEIRPFDQGGRVQYNGINIETTQSPVAYNTSHHQENLEKFKSITESVVEL